MRFWCFKNTEVFSHEYRQPSTTNNSKTPWLCSLLPFSPLWSSSSKERDSEMNLNKLKLPWTTKDYKLFFHWAMYVSIMTQLWKGHSMLLKSTATRIYWKLLSYIVRYSVELFLEFFALVILLLSLLLNFFHLSLFLCLLLLRLLLLLCLYLPLSFLLLLPLWLFLPL